MRETGRETVLLLEFPALSSKVDWIKRKNDTTQTLPETNEEGEKINIVISTCTTVIPLYLRPGRWGSSLPSPSDTSSRSAGRISRSSQASRETLYCLLPWASSWWDIPGTSGGSHPKKMSRPPQSISLDLWSRTSSTPNLS